MVRISSALIMWYRAERRALPWRCTQDPYKIWISEIILQQTRVVQGIEYYLRFIDVFPDIRSLAIADEEKVLKLWQGLGYYSRARNLHAAALQVMEHFNGKFPEQYNNVISLKGIGPYTAAAILSIAFNQPYPVIDGNVKRVVARFLAIDKPVDLAEVNKIIEGFLLKEIDRKNPGDFNQAIMELGAMICKPGKPDCKVCPISKNCRAFISDKTSDYPVLSEKSEITKRYFYYLVITEKGTDAIYLRKRTEKDIWQNLYDFPIIETEMPISKQKLILTDDWKKIFAGQKTPGIEFGPEIRHILTHRELIVRFVEVEINQPIHPDLGYIRINREEINKYPLPRLIEKFLEKKAG
jgi:A/G-specific adenine glycosylase